MSTLATTLERMARRRERLAWMKVWWLGVRRDLLRAKMTASASGWWADDEDGWGAEQWRLEGTSNRDEGPSHF